MIRLGLVRHLVRVAISRFPRSVTFDPVGRVLLVCSGQGGGGYVSEERAGRLG